MRVVGDLTLNHTGDGHEWFAAARAGGEERDFYLFGDDGSYVSWLGIPSLPKLDWRSAELRTRMQRVVQRWLEDGLDGWRIDVANMTGRNGETDVNHEVAREVRAAVGDALLLAEHNHDSRADLQGGSWHGTMNYAGFLRPVWCWLRGEGIEHPFLGLPVPIPRLSGRQSVATMRAFRAGVPWPQILHSWLLLDSHDTTRFRAVTGSRERQVVGVGTADDDARRADDLRRRRTRPRGRVGRGRAAHDAVGPLGRLGREAARAVPAAHRPAALPRRACARRHPLRACRRRCDRVPAETREERLLCLAARADHAPIRLPLDLLEADELDTLYGVDATVLDGDAILPADGPAFSVWKLERSSRG